MTRALASFDRALLARVATGAVLGPAMVVAALLDGWRALLGLPLLVVVIAIASLGTEELAVMLRKRRPQSSGKAQKHTEQPPRVGAAVGSLPPLFIYFLGRDYENWVLAALSLVIVFNVLAVALAYIADITKRKLAGALDAVLLTAGGIYIGGGLTFILLLRNLGGAAKEPMGCWPVLLLFALTWAVDISAYFAGKRLGRVRLASRVSPGKTVEGSLIGLAAAVVIMLVAFALGLRQFTTLPAAVVIGLVVGGCAQGGDLFESAVKRWAGVKDSGEMLPGHGGILDRFDSMILSAPALYVCLVLMLQ
jgi:phosphatidate cytidylyltransferase